MNIESGNCTEEQAKHHNIRVDEELKAIGLTGMWEKYANSRNEVQKKIDEEEFWTCKEGWGFTTLRRHKISIMWDEKTDLQKLHSIYSAESMGEAWNCLIHRAGLWNFPCNFPNTADTAETHADWIEELEVMAIGEYNRRCDKGSADAKRDRMGKRKLPTKQISWKIGEILKVQQLDEEIAEEIYAHTVTGEQWAEDKESYEFLKDDKTFPGWKGANREASQRLVLYSRPVQEFLWEMRVMGKVGPDGCRIRPVSVRRQCHVCTGNYNQ